MADLDLQVNFKVILLVVMTLWVEINPCLALHLAQARSSPPMADVDLQVNFKVILLVVMILWVKNKPMPGSACGAGPTSSPNGRFGPASKF
jgi:hypothetical protein